ncbi:MAG: hypothetical protein JWO31_2743 [Phycisphaerales bacterium]|nr:hypothetical protein [Phycisphaerales bacterium]
MRRLGNRAGWLLFVIAAFAATTATVFFAVSYWYDLTAEAVRIDGTTYDVRFYLGSVAFRRTDPLPPEAKPRFTPGYKYGYSPIKQIDPIRMFRQFGVSERRWYGRFDYVDKRTVATAIAEFTAAEQALLDAGKALKPPASAETRPNIPSATSISRGAYNPQFVATLHYNAAVARTADALSARSQFVLSPQIVQKGVTTFWLLPLAWAGSRVWRYAFRSRSRRRRGLCARCGYDLRGSPDRCPECGVETRRTA